MENLDPSSDSAPRERGLARLREMVRGLVRGGASPDKVAGAVALGAFWGIIPLVGTSSGCCFLSALALRLNHFLIQGVNYAMYPAQLLLLVPFIKVGGLFLGQAEAISVDDATWMERFLSWGRQGVLGWFLVAGPLAMILFWVLRGRLRKWPREAESPVPGGNHG